MLTDEHGLPLSVVPSSANTHDVKLLEATLEHIVTLRPDMEKECPQNLCLDADYIGSNKTVQAYGCTPHIRLHGEEKKELERNPDFRAHRWFVEVSHSFFNRFRKLLVRYDMKRKMLIIWRSLHLPALSLSDVNFYRFIADSDRVSFFYSSAVFWPLSSSLICG